ncbi:MAG: hypothetical protein IPM39_25815 [Chloroflexi bacterium]|nr:hypothetical protein [Chloroflexota bacterium]
MSDGENTDGSNLRGFMDYYRQLPPEAQKIRTFTVLFGDADEEAIAEITGTNGRARPDGRSESSAQFSSKFVVINKGAVNDGRLYNDLPASFITTESKDEKSWKRSS